MNLNSQTILTVAGDPLPRRPVKQYATRAFYYLMFKLIKQDQTLQNQSQTDFFGYYRKIRLQIQRHTLLEKANFS